MILIQPFGLFTSPVLYGLFISVGLSVTYLIHHNKIYSVRNLMLQNIVSIQENERERIASDIHDEVGAMISMVKLQLQSLNPKMDIDQFDTTVDETVNSIDSLMQNLKHIIKNLSSEYLKKHGLRKSIEEYKRIIEFHKKIKFNFFFGMDDSVLTESVCLNLYRIIQEMINNTMKHSNCNIIHLHLQSFERHLVFTYHDNGSMDAGNRESGTYSMGLTNILRRIKLLDGKITFNEEFAEGSYYHIIFQLKTLNLNQKCNAIES
jgi:signal transduction histidine kinase